MAAIRLLRRRPDFRRLWMAEVVSYLGDWLAYVAVAATTLEQGEGLLALAAVFVAHNLPHAILGPYAGVVADRFDRRRVMIASNAVQALLALAVAGAAAGGALLAMQVLLLARVSVAVFFSPAQSASLPRLVAADELGTANTLSSTTWSATFALGMAIGGALTAAIGPQWAIVVDAATFAVAALLLIGLPPLPPNPTGDATSGFAMIREAIAGVRNDPRLGEPLLAHLPIALAAGGGWVLINQLAADLGGDARLLGWTHAARGIGCGIGPLFLLAAAHRRPRRRRWSLAIAATLVGILACTVAQDAAGLLTGAFLWGLGGGAMWVAVNTRLQQVAPNALLGRVSALGTLAFTAAQSLTAILGALVGDALGTPRAAAAMSICIGLTAWAVYLVETGEGRRHALQATG